MGVLKFLSGKKSYLVAFGLAIVAFLKALGKIPPNVEDALLILLNGGGLAAIRAAIANQPKKK